MSTQTTTAPAPAGTLTERFALLRVALKLDAVVTGANGAAYLALAGPIGDLLELPASALRGAGAFLLVFAAVVWLLSERPAPGPAAVRAVIAANVAWALGSLGLAAAGWESPSTVGTVWIVLQALTVSGFATLQAAGQARAQRTW